MSFLPWSLDNLVCWFSSRLLNCSSVHTLELKRQADKDEPA
jgi:hypothetical protein